MLQILVRLTIVKSHGHTLGVVGHVMRFYCALCKAGLGMCRHRAAALWMQRLHWGEGQPTPNPATSDFCSWVPGSRGPRNSSTVEPASSLTIETLPQSKEASKAKTNVGTQYNMKERLDYRYDLFGSAAKKKG